MFSAKKSRWISISTRLYCCVLMYECMTIDALCLCVSVYWANIRYSGTRITMTKSWKSWRVKCDNNINIIKCVGCDQSHTNTRIRFAVASYNRVIHKQAFSFEQRRMPNSVCVSVLKCFDKISIAYRSIRQHYSVLLISTVYFNQCIASNLKCVWIKSKQKKITFRKTIKKIYSSLVKIEFCLCIIFF